MSAASVPTGGGAGIGSRCRQAKRLDRTRRVRHLPRMSAAPFRSLALVALFAPALLHGQETPVADVTEEIDECAVLAALDFDDTVGARVGLKAELVPAGEGMPAHCRVSGSVAPEVGIEVWLPADNWNGKLLVTGCYGSCGTVRADQMEDAAARGYATATSDGGHSAQKYPDGGWAYNTALEDEFGHRAVHVTTVLAKALITAYYGDHEAHAYFRGCSTGGRQGLVAAGRYPDDFEGIIAGAPFNQTLSVPAMIWAYRANIGADDKPILGKPQFELLHKAALAACDPSDGLVDGIIGDPEHCKVAPAALACAEGKTADCLTPEQVAASEKIYQGPANAAGQRLAAFGPFGAAPGSEPAWEQQLLAYDEGKPPVFLVISQAWLHHQAFEPDPPADAGTIGFDFDKDMPRVVAGAARAGFVPNLDRFSARDGRLIVHHGWADQTLQPAHTLAYWRELAAESGGAEGLDKFARLFMLPGVGHCGGGIGAGDVDYLTALERWVEKDEAPDVLIGWRTKESVPAAVRQPRFPLAGEVQLKRPVFPYPATARYDGKGDPLDPASYQRVTSGGP